MINLPTNDNLLLGFGFSDSRTESTDGGSFRSNATTPSLKTSCVPSTDSSPPPDQLPVHDFQFLAATIQNLQILAPSSPFEEPIKGTDGAFENTSLSLLDSPEPSNTPADAPPPLLATVFASLVRANATAGGDAPSSSSSTSSAFSSRPIIINQQMATSELLPTSLAAEGHGAPDLGTQDLYAPKPFDEYTATAHTPAVISSATGGPFDSLDMFNAALNANTRATPTTGTQSPFAQTTPTGAKALSISANVTTPISAFLNAEPSTPPPTRPLPGSMGPPPTPRAKIPSRFAPPQIVLPPGSLFADLASTSPESPTRSSAPPAASPFAPASLRPAAPTAITNRVAISPLSVFPSAVIPSTSLFPAVAPILNFIPTPALPVPTSLFASTTPLTTFTPAVSTTYGPIIANTPVAPATLASCNAAANNSQATSAPVFTTPLPQSLFQTSIPPHESRLKAKTLEEIISQWAADVEIYKNELHERGAEANKWDAIFFDNQDKILRLSTEVKEAERTQSMIDNALEKLEGEQEHMEKLFDYYEAAISEMEEENSVTQPMDAEREHIFDTVVELCAKLAEMEAGAVNLISALNNASARVENIDSDSHFSTIVKLLNEHLRVMRWLDNQTAVLSEKIENVRTKPKVSYLDTEEDRNMHNFNESHRKKY